MDFRKLIKFGNSSYVISLPSKWIRKNELKKGDMVYFEENGNNELILNPKEKERKSEDKEMTLDVTGKDRDYIYRELSTAYMNNFRTINIIGKDLQEKSQFVKKTLQNLMALEIMEQTSKNITAKDFLDISTISISEMIRKVDIIVRSLISDSMLTMEEDNFEDVYQRDAEVNKLSLLLFRIIKVAMNNPQSTKQPELSPINLLGCWEMTVYLERIADEAKRVSRFVSKGKPKGKNAREFKDLYSKIEKYYLDVMKAYYGKDKVSAMSLAVKKKHYIEMCDVYLKNHGNKKWIPNLAERLKMMVSGIHHILKVIYEVYE